METNEIMKNEDLIETATEEIAEVGSNCALKVAAGFGLGLLAGIVVCKFIAKPVMAKLKSRKNNMDDDFEDDFEDAEDADFKEVPKESEEEKSEE